MSSFPSLRQMSDLWQYIEKLFRNVKARPMSAEHWKRVHLKFNQLVTYITSTKEIAGNLFENEMINQEELESILSLDSTPIRASTELLIVLMRKSKEAHDAFLQTLLKTNQPHIHQLLTCEIEDCDMEHSRIIRSNYQWLIEHLDSANGLVNHLIASNVSSFQDAAEIDSEKDPRKKNEKLLSIISKKDAASYRKFLEALRKSNQEHVKEKLEHKSPSSSTNASQTNTKIFKVSENVPNANPICRPRPPPPPLHHKRTPDLNASTAIETIPKRTSVESLARIFSKLNDDLQTSISLKVVTQKTRGSIVHSCVQKTFEGLEKLKNDPGREMDFAKFLQGNLHNVSSQSIDNYKEENEKLKEKVKQLQKENPSTTREQECSKLRQENVELNKRIQQMEASKNLSSTSPPATATKSWIPDDPSKQLQKLRNENQELKRQIQESKDSEKQQQKRQNENSELAEKTESQVQKIEEENHRLSEKIQELSIVEEKVLELQKENDKLRDQSEEVQKKLEQETEEKIQKLESELQTKKKDNFRYIENPYLETTIGRDESEVGHLVNRLSRLTILENELFIVSHDQCRVDVYAANDLLFKRSWSFVDVKNVEDIASCSNNKCLYIVFWNGDRQCEEIIWCDPNGKLLMKWLTGERQGRLSITHKSQLLLTVNEKNRLDEYSPDGRLLRRIQLPSLIKHPQHSLEFEGDLYVVSYGSTHPANTAHGVCLVNVNGEVIRSFSVAHSTQFLPLNLPVYLAIDRSFNVLVADLNNNRVLLLDSELKFTRELVTVDNGLQYPRRICLDISTGRLIVASGRAGPKGIGAGQVLVFRVGSS